MNDELYTIHPYRLLGWTAYRNNEEIIDYSPTGKYRIYENDRMYIEFTYTKRIKRLFRKPLFVTRTKFISETYIDFLPTYTEYNCNAD